MANAYEKRVLRVIDYIHDHLDGDLSLDNLADIAAMSRFHWHRVFHAMTGETCANAVRRIRLNRAAGWLVQSDWPVAKVASMAGYPNLQSFSRIFAQAYGKPPSVFRKQGAYRAPIPQSPKGTYPMFPVTIETRPPLRLASIRHTGSYMAIGSKFERIGGLMATRGQMADVRGVIGLYYDDPDAVPEEKLRSLAGFAVTPESIIDDPLEELHLPGGRFAVMHHKGPYPDLSAAYKYLFGEWLPKSKEEPADGPCVEYYINDPTKTAPKELLTDVCVPLK